MSLTLQQHDPVRDGHAGVTYHAWTDGSAVGFRCVFDDGRPDWFIYLDPSTDCEPGEPTVFVYEGTAGDPTDGRNDGPKHYYVIDSEGDTSPCPPSTS